MNNGPTAVGAMTEDRELCVEAARAEAGTLLSEAFGSLPNMVLGCVSFSVRVVDMQTDVKGRGVSGSQGLQESALN